MLEANKSRWFEWFFTKYNRHLIRRRFQSLSVFGLEYLEKKDRDLPRIIFANHTSWWDGLIIFEILSRFRFDFYVMMEEKQLQQLPLFKKLGAFSVIRDQPREALKSIRYAVLKLRNRSETIVLIFPQGEIFPNDLRPLKFFGGISRLILKTENCLVLPLAVRLEFLGEYKPQIFVRIGKPELFENKRISKKNKITRKLESTLTYELDSLREDIISRNLEKYRNLL